MASVNGTDVMRAESPMMLDLERELAGPDGEAVFHARDGVLAAVEVRLKKELQQGLPPDSYVQAESLVKAAQIARKVLCIVRRRLAKKPDKVDFVHNQA